MRRAIASLALAAGAVALPAAGYETPTHSLITLRAVNASQLGARIGDIGMSMGLITSDSTLSDGQVFVIDGTAYTMSGPVSAWIRAGAVDEDSIWGARFLNHFFNPRFGMDNEGLTGFFSGRSSRVWGLESQGDIFGQRFSRRDATEYYHRSLVAPAEADRKRNLSLLFGTLGHVVHLIQDAAQPQHTRNDSHGSGSRYEGFVNDFLWDLPGIGGYPVVKLPAPGDYWANTSLSGMANYSHRGYVTAGTNFRGRRVGDALVLEPRGDFPEPDGVGHTIVREDINSLVADTDEPLIGELWFVGTTMEDRNSPGFGDLTNPRTSTFSIFDEDLMRRNARADFTMNRFNYIQQRNRLVPRAIAYSAGFIDHFVRGKLTIRAPQVGVYAYANHKDATGFKTIRARVRNDTPSENLHNGRFVAAAKFHVNGCYKADLTGEFTEDEGGNLIPPCADYRSEKETMLLSDEHFVHLDATKEHEFTFTFPSEIPMGATDLYLQVIYRGPFTGASGTTEADGIAVGTKDISEPTFLALNNATDVFELPTCCGNGFFPWREIIRPSNLVNDPYKVVDRDGSRTYNSPPDYDVTGGEIRFEFVMNDKLLATMTSVPEGRFGRLALLLNPGSFTYQVRSSGSEFNETDTFSALAKTAQVDHAANVYRVSTVDYVRGIQQWYSVTYYHYLPTTIPSAELEDMPATAQDEGTVPVDIALEDFPPSDPTP